MEARAKIRRSRSDAAARPVRPLCCRYERDIFVRLHSFFQRDQIAENRLVHRRQRDLQDVSDDVSDVQQNHRREIQSRERDPAGRAVRVVVRIELRHSVDLQSRCGFRDARLRPAERVVHMAERTRRGTKERHFGGEQITYHCGASFESPQVLYNER